MAGKLISPQIEDISGEIYFYRLVDDKQNAGTLERPILVLP